MIEAALRYLIGLGKNEIVEVNGHKYSTKNLNFVGAPTPNALTVTTLSSLVDYIKSGLDKKSSNNLLIQVKSYDNVNLYSELREDKTRELYIKCEAMLPDITIDRFMNPEDFNIMIQSCFVPTDDSALLLKVAGNIQDSAVKQVGDDGVKQAVTMKTGVAQVENVIVPNPVLLSPYRTFPELDQPISKFVFRMKSGPSAAIFEADAGAWKSEAMNSIKEYLEKELKGRTYIKIIS